MVEKFNFFVVEAEDNSPQDDFDEFSESPEDTDAEDQRVLKVRLDKWLWAARFFKTRPLARAAVEGGKVSYNEERCKPTREVEIGALLRIRIGRLERVVTVAGLSTRRHSTQKAEELYEETEVSRQQREQQSLEWQANQATQVTQPTFLQTHESNKPRKMVRFLRRTFGRQTDHAPYPNHYVPTYHHLPQEEKEFETSD